MHKRKIGGLKSERQKRKLRCEVKNMRKRKFLEDVYQGAATTVVAATTTELNGESGSYLENCNIAPLTVFIKTAEF